jgi:hypothetical protein
MVIVPRVSLSVSRRRRSRKVAWFIVIRLRVMKLAWDLGLKVQKLVDYRDDEVI